ncbi:AMIN-like domain-containing (lipo)protein [Litorihabitans aurantiacus]|uniref:AMIN-like domain-containing protein n=1 Tax=Litorihabitans aurantiacus TaxID=1930061 RepID=A0AA38CV56_9MICO|nr:hypothetical protein [Litorihabitans aurantiacus]GMA33324.1 hypothetical protein GCM10025875_33160 [Litorihabitans aurantiacus]
MRYRTTTLIAATGAAALLAGCSSGTDDEAPPATETSTATATETATETASPSPTEPSGTATTSEPAPPPPDDEAGDAAPAFPTTTDPQTGESDSTSLHLEGVRVSEHDGFDRIVLDFAGEGLPGWDVQYVPAAESQGSGAPIPLEGDAVLQITGIHTMPEDPAAYETEPVVEGDAGAVEQVVYDTLFEGRTVVFAGVDEGAVPFRVFALGEPSRLVVDVLDDDD